MPQHIPSPGSGAVRAILTRSGIDFFTSSGSVWNENSPLPPGTRYVELADLYVTIATTFASYPQPQNVYFFGLDDNALPKDSAGNVRRNLRPCGVDVSTFNLVTLNHLPSGPAVAASLAGIYADDSMWTGEVVDPVNWQDDWWDAALLIDRDKMQIYLDAHPGSRLNS